MLATSSILSAGSAENQTYGECTAHVYRYLNLKFVYKVAFELRSALLRVVLKLGSQQTKNKGNCFPREYNMHLKKCMMSMYALAKKLEEYSCLEKNYLLP
jgi:hypothetical protein